MKKIATIILMSMLFISCTENTNIIPSEDYGTMIIFEIETQNELYSTYRFKWGFENGGMVRYGSLRDKNYIYKIGDTLIMKKK